MTDDNYPTEEELELVGTTHDPREMMELVADLWAYAQPGFSHVTDTNGSTFYTLHTLGWSGNESLIAAMKQNLLFWTMCWQSTMSGGHYLFKVRP